MKRLGYTRYVAQGGDWGAFVVDQMGLQAPAGLLAIHTNMPATVPADVDKALQAGGPAPSGLSAEEQRAYEQLVRTFKQVDYARLMGSRPQTLYGIADSPVGLAAWLLDHNDADGQPAATVAAALSRTTSATGELTRDEILDNITLYWLTNTASLRLVSTGSTTVRPILATAKGVSDSGCRDSSFPGEHLSGPAELGRAGVSQTHLLQRGRQRRPLRRLGRAAALRGRGARGVQVAAVAQRRRWTTRLTCAPSAVRRSRLRAACAFGRRVERRGNWNSRCFCISKGDVDESRQSRRGPTESRAL